MATSAFGIYVEVEPSSANTEPWEIPIIPSAPPKALPHNYHSIPQEPPDDIELDNLQWGAKLTGPTETEANLPRTDTPSAPVDLEMSRTSSPAQEYAEVEALQSFSNPPMNKFRMLSVCLVNFNTALNDGVLGALIPYIESYYKIGYAIVSLIFITNAIGFISAALVVDAVRANLGRGRTTMFANALCACAYIAIVCTPPFPMVVACHFFLGFGMAVNLSLGNVFSANLQNGTQMLGIMHGFYGLGGILGPLIATAMVTSSGLIWSRFYILTLAMAVANAAFSGWAFWNYEKETSSSSANLSIIRSNPSRRHDAAQSEDQRNANTTAQSIIKPGHQFSSMVKAFKNRTVLLGALFIFAYQGAEVSISGWVISFLLTTRKGNPASVGYVTSGFWAGITFGRFLLSHPAHKVGEKIFVYCVVVGAAAFQLLVWLVPNVIGDAVAVAIVGLLLGPVYPCAAAIFTRSLSRSTQVSGLGVISAFGSSGGAVAPFTTGILAQAVGTFVLHPIAIALFVVMLGSWYGLPNIRKRRE